MGSSSSIVQCQLDQARSAWACGAWEAARQGAQACLRAAVACRDRHLEAGACLLLAQALSQESRFSWASGFARRAHALWSAEGDPARVLECLWTLSYVDSALGQPGGALAAAEAALAASAPASLEHAVGLNGRGIAALWAGNYPTARAALREAGWLAAEASCRSARFQPLTNALLLEVLRCASAGEQASPAEFSGLHALLAETWDLVRAGAVAALRGGSPEPGWVLLEFASCFLASREADLQNADAHYLACLERAARLPAGHWMQALVWWARLERNLAAGEAGEAAISAASLVACADAGEHRPLAALAHFLGFQANQLLDLAAAMPPCYAPAGGAFAANAESAFFRPLPACQASTRRECRACVRNAVRLHRSGGRSQRA